MNKIPETVESTEPVAFGNLLLTDELLEVGRKRIEDELIEWRDSRLSMFPRGNGLVIREKDGTESSMIRFGPEHALKIGIKAMLEAIAAHEAQRGKACS